MCLNSLRYVLDIQFLVQRLTVDYISDEINETTLQISWWLKKDFAAEKKKACKNIMFVQDWNS